VERAGVGEPTGVAQRRLLLVVPAGPPVLAELGPGAVCVDHLGGRDHRVGARLAGHGNAVLDLGAHHTPHTHATTLVARPATRLAPCGLYFRKPGELPLPPNSLGPA